MNILRDSDTGAIVGWYDSAIGPYESKMISSTKDQRMSSIEQLLQTKKGTFFYRSNDRYYVMKARDVFNWMIQNGYRENEIPEPLKSQMEL